MPIMATYCSSGGHSPNLDSYEYLHNRRDGIVLTAMSCCHLIVLAGQCKRLCRGKRRRRGTGVFRCRLKAVGDSDESFKTACKALGPGRFIFASGGRRCGIHDGREQAE